MLNFGLFRRRWANDSSHCGGRAEEAGVAVPGGRRYGTASERQDHAGEGGFSRQKYVTFEDRPMRELASSNPRDFLMAS